MPGGERSKWYPAALIVGTAVATFLLGATTTLWLAAARLPAVVHGTASAPGTAAPGANRPPAPAGSPVGREQTATAQATLSGAAQPAEAAATARTPPAAPASAPASAPGPAAQAGNFSLQLGAFLDPAKAKLVVAQLAARGYTPASVDAADGYGRTWHFVRLGAFADEPAAAVAASDLFARAGIGAAVIRLPAANAAH